MIISLTLLISGQTAALCFSGLVECRSGTPPLSLTELARSWIQLTPVNGIIFQDPADDGSRGLPVTSITSGSRWLNGPAFLLFPEEKWPKGISTLQLRKQAVDEPHAQDMTVTWIGVEKDTKNEYFSLVKYSSLTNFLRVTAYLTRFIYNCRHSKSERRIGTLLVEEIELARKFWIRITQAESFPQEVAALKSKQHVSSKSKLVSLSPFLDKH